ncbi:hypothetical protein [Cupriavidus necator]|nr:hypothetical protein [Cupriavidus necator]
MISADAPHAAASRRSARSRVALKCATTSSRNTLRRRSSVGT